MTPSRSWAVEKETWTSVISSKGHHIMLTQHSLAHHIAEWNHWDWNLKEKEKGKQNSREKEQKINVRKIIANVFFHPISLSIGMNYDSLIRWSRYPSISSFIYKTLTICYVFMSGYNRKHLQIFTLTVLWRHKNKPSLWHFLTFMRVELTRHWQNWQPLP